MAGKTGKKRGRRPTSPPWWAFAGAITVAALGVAVLIAIGAATRGDDDGSSGEIVMPSPLPSGLARQGKLLGDPAAPVAIVEYADFQ